MAYELPCWTLPLVLSVSGAVPAHVDDEPHLVRRRRRSSFSRDRRDYLKRYVYDREAQGLRAEPGLRGRAATEIEPEEAVEARRAQIRLVEHTDD